MCGILAVAAKPGKELDHGRCQSALEKLKRRGEDLTWSNLLLDGRLFLGQTTLSITGNSYAMAHWSQKTMCHCILFNGEIYNYRELYERYLASHGYTLGSGTDTEVLANLHEELTPKEAHRELQGMFAYVAWDSGQQAFYIGRDMLGEKILFMHDGQDAFVISSEIASILEVCPSLRIDPERLYPYFFTRHFLSPRKTVFQEIELVPPGFLVKYNVAQGSKTIETVLNFDISLDRIVACREQQITELADKLEKYFCASARALVPEKKPYACAFSGGVDSSLAASYLSEVRSPDHLITLQFPSKDEVSKDLVGFESRLGREIEKIVVDEEMYLSHLERCYEVACSPLPTHSYVSQSILAQAVKAAGCKILVTGEGGDELFGGYEAYKRFPPEIDDNPSPYSGFVDHGVELERYDSRKAKGELWNWWKSALAVYRGELWEERAINTALFVDTKIQLESVGIRSADQASMMHGVEARGFFLVRDVVEFALNLPARCKVRRLGNTVRTKPLLKYLFVHRFGPELLRPKQGFAGYPNEAARRVLGEQCSFPLVREVLGPFKAKWGQEWSRDAYWKLANVEMFLRKFSRFI